MTVKLDREKVRREFTEVVNMTAPEIEKWLQTLESKKVGFKGADGSRWYGRTVIRPTLVRQRPSTASPARDEPAFDSTAPPVSW